MKNKFKLGMLITALSLTLVGCSSDKPSTKTEEETVAKTNLEEFQSTDREFYVNGDISMRSDSTGTYLEGSIKNNSGEKANYISINFDLFDANNKKVGTAMANVNNIENGQNWEFFAKSQGLKVEEAPATEGNPVADLETTEENPATEGDPVADLETTEEEKTEGEEAPATEEETTETIVNNVDSFKITEIEGY